MRKIENYIWAAPVTAIGLSIGGLTLITGGKVQVRSGVLEFHGGFTTSFLKSPVCGAKAMTLGHVILGRDEDQLNENREHEHGHVRQAETWGVFFLPAYIAASLCAILRGKHYYDDNWFEQDAEQEVRKTNRS